ncbi:MAG: hypothetical protein ACK5C3_01190 [bacterium]
MATFWKRTYRSGVNSACHAAFRLTTSASLVLGALLSTPASASDPRSVSELRVHLQDWTLVPTLEGPVVESFIATRAASELNGDNIEIVWFLRGEGNAWSAYAWPQGGRSEAVAYIKEQLGVVDQHPAWSEVAGTAVLLDAPAIVPAEFGLGVMKQDPFLPVVEALPDPHWFIDALTDSGWKAASIPLQLDCPTFSQDQVLTSLAAKVEAGLSSCITPDDFEREVALLCNCGWWESLTAPLDDDGAWTVPNLSWHLARMLGVPPSSVTQTPAPGLTVVGVGTIVIRGTSPLSSQDPTEAARIVISLMDVASPALTVDVKEGGESISETPLGVPYVVAPAIVSVDASASDLPMSGDVEVTATLNGEEVSGPVQILNPGVYGLEVTARDHYGNTSIHRQLIFAARRPVVEAQFAIESIEAFPNGQVETIVKVMTDERDPRLICPRFVSLQVVSYEREIAATLSLPDEAGGSGEYDPAWARFENGTWRLRLRGSHGALAEDLESGSLQCFLSGRSFVTIGEFDLISGWSPFVEAAQQLLTPPDGSGLGSQNGEISEGGDDLQEPPCEWEVVISNSFCIARSQVPSTQFKEANSNARAGFFGVGSNSYAWGWYEGLDVDIFSDNSVSTVSNCAAVGTVSVKRKGKETSGCCQACELQIRAQPTFSARARINPPASATVAARIKISTPCGTVDASGGVALSSFGTNSIAAGVGTWTVVLPIPAGAERDEQSFGDVQLCTVPSCEVMLIWYSYAYAAARAHPELFDWQGQGTGSIFDGKLGLSFKVRENCGSGGGGWAPLPTFEDGWYFGN